MARPFSRSAKTDGKEQASPWGDSSPLPCMGVQSSGFASHLDTIGDSVFLLDTNHKIVLCNSATLVKLDKPFKDVINRKCFELFHQTDCPIPHCPVSLASVTGKPQSVVTEDEGRYFLITATPVFGKDRTVSGYVHTITETTRQRTLLDKLEKSEQKFRSIFDNAASLILTMDKTGRILSANHHSQEILGYSAEEITHKSIDDIVLPEDLAEAARDIDAIAGEGKSLRRESILVRKDGKRVHVRIAASRLTSSSAPNDSILAIIEDITREKKAETALLESERQFRILFDRSADGILIADPHTTKFKYANPSLCSMLGYTLEEISELGMKDIHPKHQLERVTNAFRAQVEGKQTLALDIPCSRKDGTTVYADVNATLVSLQGQPCLVGFFRDTTRQKQEAAERKRLEEQLQHSEKLQAIGQLAGGVAHDFNNILMAIAGYADLIASAVPDKPDLHRYANHIINSAKHGGTVTNQLLAFARKGQYIETVADVHEIIESVFNMLMHTIDKRIQLDKRLKASESAVKLDTNQFQNVLLNLGLNARDAMPHGGELYYETETVLLDQEYCDRQPFDCSPGKYVQICICDTGTGMDKETREHVFEPFFTTKEKGKGTGLGLASAYGFVKQNKGYINVYSIPGEGTTFKIYLPVVENVKPKAKKTAAEKQAGSGRILLIDDEPPIREITALSLTGMGYEVLCAADGGQAIEIYERDWQKLDLVILDMIMPGMNGQDCFARFREISDSVPVIVSSGFSMNNDMQKMLDSGVKDWIQKPFKMNDLSVLVAKTIKGGKEDKETE